MANQKNKNKKKNTSHKHVYQSKKNPKKGNNRVQNKENNTQHKVIYSINTLTRINRAYVLLISIVWKEVEK